VTTGGGARAAWLPAGRRLLWEEERRHIDRVFDGTRVPLTHRRNSRDPAELECVSCGASALLVCQAGSDTWSTALTTEGKQVARGSPDGDGETAGWRRRRGGPCNGDRLAEVRGGYTV
jgi:hypothetical protein